MSASPLPAPRSIRSLAAAAAIAAALLALVGTVAGQTQANDSGPAPQHVDVVRVDGAIAPPMARYVAGAIRQANADGAVAVVLELDTPGGLMTSMDEIVAAIAASPTPVIVYVGPSGARAASAGVFITYAGHVAAMAPGTRIGSASPVTFGPDGAAAPDETMTAKITNDAVSQIRNLADRHGRNADWAEAAVRDAANVTADEAERLGVVDLVAPDVPSLLRAVDGRTIELATGPATLRTAGVEVRPVTMSWLDELLQLLADPTVAYILLSLGGLGLFLELSNPGAVLPGVVGGLGTLLGLFGLGTLPVNWTGVLLIGFGFLLFAVDLFVPSFGALTVGGVVIFVLGSYLLLGADAPPGLAIAPTVIWTMTALLVVFFLVVGASVLRTRWRKPSTGREGMIGAVGVVRRALDPNGVVFAAGELWQATAGRGVPGAARPVPVGTPVAVEALDGLRLVARLAAAPEVAAAGVDVVDAGATASDPQTGPNTGPVPVSVVGSGITPFNPATSVPIAGSAEREAGPIAPVDPSPPPHPQTPPPAQTQQESPPQSKPRRPQRSHA